LASLRHAVIDQPFCEVKYDFKLAKAAAAQKAA
jgi:hypothetical protein